MVKVQGDCAEFRFYRPHARSVQLVGDFNGWNRHELPMTPTGDGHWQASLRLEPGTYRFRYHADGQWFADYAAFGITYGPYGADSILRICGRPADADPKPAVSHREPAEADALGTSMGEAVPGGPSILLGMARTASSLIQAA